MLCLGVVSSMPALTVTAVRRKQFGAERFAHLEGLRHVDHFHVPHTRVAAAGRMEAVQRRSLRC